MKRYNSIIKTLIMLLIFVVLLPSCNGLIGIEKRKHLSGYHIDISKDLPKDKPLKKSQNIDELVSQKKQIDQDNTIADDNSDIKDENISPPDCDIVASVDNEIILLDNTNSIKLYTKPIPTEEPDNNDEIDDTPAYINLVLDILALTSILLWGILSVMGLSVNILFIAIIVFSVLAFWFSLFSLIKLKKRSSSIKNKLLYKAAIWLGMIAFFIVSIIAIIWWFTSFAIPLFMYLF